MIEVIKQVGDQVVQKITRPDGTLVRFQYGTVGGAMQSAGSEKEAVLAITPDIVRVVDRKGDQLVEKVLNASNGKLKFYRHGKQNGEMVIVASLTAARQAIGAA